MKQCMYSNYKQLLLVLVSQQDAIKMYEVYEYSALRSIWFNSGAHWVGDWMGPRAN